MKCERGVYINWIHTLYLRLVTIIHSFEIFIIKRLLVLTNAEEQWTMSSRTHRANEYKALTNSHVKHSFMAF